MIKKLFPIILALAGIGGGIGTGLMLKPKIAETAEVNPDGEVDQAEAKSAETQETKDDAGPEDWVYVKLNNQFVIPIVGKETVDALVVMSLSIEVEPGQTETVYEREPKLRDAFLQVLFDHANIGGFQGEFTDSSNMDVLRATLTEAAQSIIGMAVNSVLITELIRQDV